MCANSQSNWLNTIAVRIKNKKKCLLATHELQKAYFAFQGSRNAAGFYWNAPLTTQVKRDCMQCNSQQRQIAT